MTENAAPDWPDWGLAAAVNAPDVGTATLWMRGELTRASARRPRACDGRWDAQLSEDTKHVEPAISQRGEQRDNDDSDHDSLPALAPLPRLGR